MTKVNAMVLSGLGPASVCTHTVGCCAFKIRATDVLGNVDRFSENFFNDSNSRFAYILRRYGERGEPILMDP